MIDFNGLLDEHLDDGLKHVTPQERKAISSATFHWLATVARKKPVPDLPQRLERMQSRIETMADQMVFQVKDGVLGVDVKGSASDVFVAIMFGTDWFAGHPDFLSFVARTLYPGE